MDALTQIPAQPTNTNSLSRPTHKPKKFLYKFRANFCHVPCIDRRGKNALFHSSRSHFSFLIICRRMKVPIIICFTFTQMIIMLIQVPFFINPQTKPLTQNTVLVFFLHDFLVYKNAYQFMYRKSIFHVYVLYCYSKNVL